MKIPDARALLSYAEMKQVTDKALAIGPFSIQNVRRIGQRVEVSVVFPNTSHKPKTIILDQKAVTLL